MERWGKRGLLFYREGHLNGAREEMRGTLRMSPGRAEPAAQLVRGLVYWSDAHECPCVSGSVVAPGGQQ